MSVMRLLMRHTSFAWIHECMIDVVDRQLRSIQLQYTSKVNHSRMYPQQPLPVTGAEKHLWFTAVRFSFLFPANLCVPVLWPQLCNSCTALNTRLLCTAVSVAVNQWQAGGSIIAARRMILCCNYRVCFRALANFSGTKLANTNVFRE